MYLSVLSSTHIFLIPSSQHCKYSPSLLLSRSNSLIHSPHRCSIPFVPSSQHCNLSLSLFTSIQVQFSDKYYILANRGQAHLVDIQTAMIYCLLPKVKNQSHVHHLQPLDTYFVQLIDIPNT